MVAALVHGLVDNFYFVADLAIVFWLQVALVDLMFTGTSPDYARDKARQVDEAG
jgi:hypothetical protein